MLLFPDTLWVLALALLLDAIIGDPDWLWRRWAHPVVWFGMAIHALDQRWNREVDSLAKRRAQGIVGIVILLVLFLGATCLVQVIIARAPFGWIMEAILASVLLAQNSLWRHVMRVAEGLEQRGLARGREAVSMIVGRDPASLDESGVARAAIESTAENFSDGVVAPVFWFALLGLPGLVAYKLVNTADSMIGHLNDRYRAFGWGAARLDDLMNLAPARIAGALVGLAAPVAGGSVMVAFRIMTRDASLHRSPNAGWPEAAMAGALGIALAGPRRYGARLVDDPFLHAEGRRDAHAGDIRRALRVLVAACFLQFVLVVIFAVFSA